MSGWRYTDAANVAHLMERAHQNLLNVFPEAADLQYNFKHGRYEIDDQTGELSPLEKLLSSLPPLPQEELDRQERAVVRLRERLLSIPYYAERDRQDGLNFFRNSHSSHVLTDD
jgi:hypothetical protein